ncbi:MAG: hypothetical protein CSB47_07290 [Proteobacteria bacterium]|nr:MAG: hypothetical protein CSB47_07290 [Pseudomonadota bacterium]
MFKNTLQTGYSLLVCAVAISGIMASNVYAADAIVDREYQYDDKVVADIPAGNFQVSGEEVTSTEDGLVWSRCLVGQTYVPGSSAEDGSCSGDATEFQSWKDALNAVTEQQKAEGWRVANIKELMRIIDNRYIFPATNRELFLFARGLKYKQENSNGLALRNGSSPYLWSSTPKKYPTTREKGWSPMTKEESAADAEEKGKIYDLVYALDMSDGNVVVAYRDGKSRGEHQADPKRNFFPDPDHVEKARYVLLVKTYQP